MDLVDSGIYGQEVGSREEMKCMYDVDVGRETVRM